VPTLIVEPRGAAAGAVASLDDADASRTTGAVAHGGDCVTAVLGFALAIPFLDVRSWPS